jgi:hypothetical protein
MIERLEPLNGKDAAIIFGAAMTGEPVITEVRKYLVDPPRPYAQYDNAVWVRYWEPGRRDGYDKYIVPGVHYCIIACNGSIVYDSRDEVPCDGRDYTDRHRKGGVRTYRIYGKLRTSDEWQAHNNDRLIDEALCRIGVVRR